MDSPIKRRSRRGTLNSSTGNPKTSRRSKETCDNPEDGSRKSRRRKPKNRVTNDGSSRSSRRTCGSQTESIVSDAESLPISISSDV